MENQANSGKKQEGKKTNKQTNERSNVMEWLKRTFVFATRAPVLCVCVWMKKNKQVTFVYRFRLVFLVTRAVLTGHHLFPFLREI